MHIKYKVFTFTDMITTATINIDDRIKKAGQEEAKNLKLRGKFSEYVEILIKDDLEKKERAAKKAIPGYPINTIAS